MEKFLGRFAIVLMLFLAGTIKAYAVVEAYEFDPYHSFLTYHISHFGFSNPTGKWSFKGKLILDDEKPQNSKVNAVFQLGEVDTDVSALNDHLRGKLFFDVANFPTATFVSTKVIPTGKNTAKVEGMLTMHGVTRPLTLEVTANKVGFNPITEKKTIGFTATAQLRRSEYGIVTLLPEVGDLVKIDIDAEAGLASGG